MKKNKTITNIVFNIFKTGINILFPILIFPYVSRVIGPENLGKVDFVNSIVSYFTLFASMGIPTYGIIACSSVRKDKRKLEQTVSELLMLNFIFLAITEICLLLVTISVSKLNMYTDLIVLNAIGMLFNIMGIEWFFSSIEEFKYITIRSFIVKVISFILIFLLIKTDSDYIIYAAIIVLSNVGANIFNIIYSRKFITYHRVKFHSLKKHLNPIFVYFGASIASTINSNTDIVMLGFFKDDNAVGLYSFAVKIKLLLSSIVTAGLSTLIPKFSYLYSVGKINDFRKLLRNTLLFTMVIAIGISGYCIISANEIIQILGGEKYVGVRKTMIVLDLCVIVLGATWTYGVGVLQACRKEKAYAKTIGVSCIINVILNILLIPALSHLGAAIATFVTELVNLMLFIYYSREIVGNAMKSIKIYRVLLSGVVASGLAKGIMSFIHINLFFDLFIKAAIYFIIYIGINSIVNNELRSKILNLNFQK